MSIGQLSFVVAFSVIPMVVGGAACNQHETEDVSPSLATSTNLRATTFRSDFWFLPDEDLLGFVEIPAGAFIMGSDPRVDPQAFENERWAPDQTQGTVELPTFYISRFEVTVGQFLAFVDATGHSATRDTFEKPLDHPVASISWPDALAYCRWLEKTLKDWPDTPVLLRRLLQEGWHVTLPTEAQWEKAARSTDGRIYPWGNQPEPGRAIYGDQSGPGPAGSMECDQCANGLHDMSGNVWELTQSPYRPYPYIDRPSHGDLNVDALFVMRGGSFLDRENNIRTATRGGADPGAKRPFIGFRTVISPP